MKKTGKTRRQLHFGVFAVVLVFIFTASAAFPGPWNSAVDAIGAGPKFSEEGFQLGLDLQGGAHLVYEANMDTIPNEDRADALEGVRDVIERRVNAFGIAEPVVQTNITPGSYRVIVELAGVFDVGEAIADIGETPILEFKIPEEAAGDLEASEEQELQILEAQVAQKEAAEDVLRRALDGEDFAELAAEFSINPAAAQNGGDIGAVQIEDPTFRELIQTIEEEDIDEGIYSEIYEANSSQYIVNFVGVEEQAVPYAAHILICHNESTACEAERTKEEAEDFANELLEDVTPENFGEFAQEHSDGPTASVDGELGPVYPGEMVQEFEDALFALDSNEISDVVETEFGYHIIWNLSTNFDQLYDFDVIEMEWTTVEDLFVQDGWANTELSGKHVKGASVAFDPNTGLPYVSIQFNAEGAELFENLTEEQTGNVIGIFLDGFVISAPVVQQAIYGGEASITGNFTIDEARLLAQRLNAGALPVPIELLSQQTVGPTLGAISLESSVNAALIGFALVALFMIVYYRFAGLLAVLALAVYAAVNLAMYKWLGVTLTLSGIAGFILSMGMAVDANVLIFERLKEELKSGRDLPTAIDEGFRRAWSSIRDGNLTTLIAAAVLFSMATSFIRGFALTLALGIVLSMLTAIFVTRILLKWFSGFKLFKNKWLYGGKASSEK